MFFSKSLIFTSIVSVLYWKIAAANDAFVPRGLNPLRRDDDPNDGSSCDPCDESCDAEKLDLADVPYMLPANDTSPWGETETMRWRFLETVDDSGQVQTAYTLEFSCDKIADVCNNMCYGVYCKTGHTWDLTIQRDNTANCQKARRANKCGSTSPNYCSAKIGFAAGYSCDEYPFASTKQGQTSTTTATRCVNKGENSSQGGTISGFYKNGGSNKSKLPDGTDFTVKLLKAASSTNCASYIGKTKDCNKGTSVSGKSQA